MAFPMYFMSPACNEITQPNTDKGVFTGSPVVGETAETFPIYYCVFRPHLFGCRIFSQKPPPYPVLEIRSWNNGVSTAFPFLIMIRFPMVILV